MKPIPPIAVGVSLILIIVAFAPIPAAAQEPNPCDPASPAQDAACGAIAAAWYDAESMYQEAKDRADAAIPVALDAGGAAMAFAFFAADAAYQLATDSAALAIAFALLLGSAGLPAVFAILDVLWGPIIDLVDEGVQILLDLGGLAMGEAFGVAETGYGGVVQTWGTLVTAFLSVGSESMRQGFDGAQWVYQSVIEGLLLAFREVGRTLGQVYGPLEDAYGAGYDLSSSAFHEAWTQFEASTSAAWGLLTNGGNLLEPDEDLNELGDLWEAQVCQAHDIPEPCNLFEALNEIALCFQVGTDFDCDGLDLIQESCWGTNPLDPDSDNDEWFDGPEAEHWKSLETTPDQCQHQGGTLVRYRAALRDQDHDGKPNILDRDSDADSLQDGDEAHGTWNQAFEDASTKPQAKDSDGDGLSDYEELCDRRDQFANFDCPDRAWGTDPNRVDTDDDGASDGAEADHWGEANYLTDYDGDGETNNLLDPDADGDSMPDQANALDGDELNRHPSLNPSRWDTDGDRMPDGYELHYDLQPAVADGGLDADGDGLTNHEEYAWERPDDWAEATQGVWAGGFDPADPDMDDDLLLDGQEVDGSENAWKASEHYLGFPGSTNVREPDTDGDQLDDGLEALVLRTDPNDGSGDADGDGLSDRREHIGWNVHPNGASYHVTSDPLQENSDSDGWNDRDEFLHGGDPRKEDTDGDGLTDSDDAFRGCLANEADSDADGLGDAFETTSGSDPYQGVTDCSKAHTDGDGVSDGVEIAGFVIQVNGVETHVRSNPLLPNSDYDALTDAEEHALRTHPEDGDADRDFLTDADEVRLHGTNPLERDTDHDGVDDNIEVDFLLDPNAADTDDDGLSDARELDVGLAPGLPDTDRDGLDDYAELVVYGSDPWDPDSDDDLLPDSTDLEPWKDEQAPIPVEIDSWDYRYEFYVTVLEGKTASLPKESFTVNGVDLGGDPCLGMSVVDATINPYRSGDLTTFHVKFDPPVHCNLGTTYEFEILDEDNNRLGLKIVVNDMGCAKQYAIDLVRPLWEQAQQSMVTGTIELQSDMGFKRVGGKLEMLWKVAKKPLMVVDVIVTAAGIAWDMRNAALDYTACLDDDASEAEVRQEGVDVGVQFIDGADGTRVALYDPGSHQLLVGANARGYHRGAGLQRAQAEMFDPVTKNDIVGAVQFGSVGSYADSDYTTYCRGDVRVLVWENFVVTAESWDGGTC